MVVWQVLTETVRGASHHRNGLPNQDAIGVYQATTGDVPLIVAVADGHGSKRCTHSHLGAKFAVEVALETVQQVFRFNDLNLAQSRLLMETIPKTISQSWRDKIDCYIQHDLRIEDCMRLNAPLKKSYLAFGTTLLVACVLKNCILFWQIGDGDMAVIEADNSLTLPIVHDARLLGNDTTSLCSDKAFLDFRYACVPLVTIPKAIFLVTDGYKNSFKVSAGFYQALTDINDYIMTDGADSVQQELAGWLNESSEQGSGDDISLAVIFTQG